VLDSWFWSGGSDHVSLKRCKGEALAHDENGSRSLVKERELVTRFIGIRKKQKDREEEAREDNMLTFVLV
jgi:hypothetical protein